MKNNDRKVFFSTLFCLVIVFCAGCSSSSSGDTSGNTGMPPADQLVGTWTGPVEVVFEDSQGGTTKVTSGHTMELEFVLLEGKLYVRNIVTGDYEIEVINNKMVGEKTLNSDGKSGVFRYELVYENNKISGTYTINVKDEQGSEEAVYTFTGQKK